MDKCVKCFVKYCISFLPFFRNTFHFFLFIFFITVESFSHILNVFGAFMLAMQLYCNSYICHYFL